MISDPDPRALSTEAATNLAPYKAPRRIWILDAAAFPQNHTGKVLRRELQARFAETG